MRIGTLRHRVTIQQLVAGSPQQYDTGEPDESWTDVATVWASVEPLQGRELTAAQEVHSEAEVRIKMRYRSGVTAKMRVSFDGVYYSILVVLDKALRHIELDLICRTGVNDG